MPIQVKVNGKMERLENPMPLLAFLRQKDLEPESVVVEHNREIIAKTAFRDITLEDNDQLEILRFVGGG